MVVVFEFVFGGGSGSGDNHDNGTVKFILMCPHRKTLQLEGFAIMPSLNNPTLRS